jgi:DNA gyrase subunit A
MARRRQNGEDEAADEAALRAKAAVTAAREELGANRLADLEAHQQLILSVTANGFGKRTSAYEYRVSGRGGKGIAAMVVNERNGPLVASFPIEDGDQIMLVTDAGKLIRTPIIDVRIASRNTQGVRVFRTDVNERVVSVERIPEEVAAEDEAGEDDGEAGPDAPEAPRTEE